MVSERDRLQACRNRQQRASLALDCLGEAGTVIGVVIRGRTPVSQPPVGLVPIRGESNSDAGVAARCRRPSSQTAMTVRIG